MTKKIGVDFDGTIWPTIDNWRHLSGDDRFQMEDCHSWDHPVEWAGGLAPFMELVDRGCSYEAMVGHRPYPDAIKTLDWLQRAGHEVWIITARPDSALPAISQILAREKFRPKML